MQETYLPRGISSTLSSAVLSWPGCTLTLAGGCTHVWPGGSPSLARGEYSILGQGNPHLDLAGVHPSGSGWGAPHPDLSWVPPPGGGQSENITYRLTTYTVGNYSRFITARVCSMREGNVLTRVCPSINLSVHRGVPISHNALQHFPECHGADTGGGYRARSSWEGEYPARSSWGVPCRGVPYGGTLPGEGGTLLGIPCPGGYPTGYPPGRVPPQPGQDGGGYPVRTTEGVVTMRYASCVHAGGLSCYQLHLLSRAPEN